MHPQPIYNPRHHIPLLPLQQHIHPQQKHTVNRFYAPSRCQVHKQWVEPIQFHRQFTATFNSLCRLLDQQNSYYIKENEDELACGEAQVLIGDHEAGEKGRVTVGVAVVRRLAGGCVLGCFGVDLVVDVGEGEGLGGLEMSGEKD